MIFMEEYEYVSKKEYRPIEIQLEQIIRKVQNIVRLYFSLQAFMIWKNAADILTSIEYIQSVDINLIATEKGIVNDLRRMLYVRNQFLKMSNMQ